MYRGGSRGGGCWSCNSPKPLPMDNSQYAQLTNHRSAPDVEVIYTECKPMSTTLKDLRMKYTQQFSGIMMHCTVYPILVNNVHM